MHIDIETKSSVSLKDCGVYKYAESDDFEVLLIAYSIDGGEVELIDLTEEEGKNSIPGFVADFLLNPDYVKFAYNAEFEYVCLSKMAGTWLDPEQWRDTMMHAAYCGISGSLGSVGAVLGLEEDRKKDKAGKMLIRTFCTPHKHTKNDTRDWILPHEEPEKWESFKEYNRQDVVAEEAIEDALSAFPVPDAVQRQWEHNLRMSVRGVAIDMDLVDGAIELGEKAAEPLRAMFESLTGIDKPSKVAQLKNWLGEREVYVDSLAKDAVDNLIKETTGSVREVLKIRKELSKSSTKKYNSAKSIVCRDGRAHGLLAFYGASRTGRYAGRLIQVQNLPRTYLHGAALDTARYITKQADAESMAMIYGSASDTLSQLIRTVFIPKEGHKFIDADFSSIEARVLAWLAGEDWSLEVFRTHGKIYEAQASQMFNVPIEKIKKGNPEYSLRQKGKVAVLALGYQGGVGALKSMGALDMGIPEKDLPGIVKMWRRTNPKSVALWRDIEEAAKRAVRIGAKTRVGCITIRRAVNGARDFMVIDLPSGRSLHYANPGLFEADENGQISYWAQNQTSRKWSKLETYGGKLTENIVQAVARDCLVEKMLQLEAAGYNVVFHIHDEVVIEATEDQHLADVVEIMKRPVSWAPDLPLNADGWEGYYFTKD